MDLDTWNDVMRNNGYLLGSIELGYPITCDCMKYLMASDWTYIIQIVTHQGERQGLRKQERETSYVGEVPQTDIRLAIYRKVSCNDRLYQSRGRPYIGQQEVDLPPVFVPKTFEASRYPNHVMIVSYDYACLPQMLSSDMLKLEKA